MNPFTIFLVYTLCWWMTLFCVLPFGIVAQNEVEKERVPGTVGSAPVKLKLKKKMIITSVIAAVLTFIYWLIVTFELITINPFAKP